MLRLPRASRTNLCHIAAKAQSLVCEGVTPCEGNLSPIALTVRAMAAITRLSVLFWLDLMASAWALDEAVGSLRGAGHNKLLVQSARIWR